MLLVVCAGLLFQAAARADEVVLTAASFGVDFALIDRYGIEPSGPGIAVLAALEAEPGPGLLFSATDGVFPDAGFVLLAPGGILTRDLPGVAASPGFVENSREIEAPQE